MGMGCKIKCLINTLEVDGLGKSFWHGFWRLADPKISLASFAGMYLGACMAAKLQSLEWSWLALTVLGVFLVEVAKNASGEVVDFDSGTDLAVGELDRTPFSGGKRVLVDGLLTRRQTSAIAAVCYGFAIVIGLALVLWRDVNVLFFGVAGMALAWFYHSGPLKLSYRGLGELAVAMAYGPLVVCGTYLVQTGTVDLVVLQIAIALGMLVAAFLWINQVPDYSADKASGKRNLVVKLGRQKAMAAYVVLIVVAYSWLIFTSQYYDNAQALLWGLAGLPLALFSAWRLLDSDAITRELIPAQAASLASFVLMAAAAGTGYFLS
jgi:1,4-dihydroxy-2-naphthoate octaprenyltransferase